MGRLLTLWQRFKDRCSDVFGGLMYVIAEILDGL